MGSFKPMTDQPVPALAPREGQYGDFLRVAPQELVRDVSQLVESRADRIALGQLCLKYHRMGWSSGWLCGAHPSGEFEHLLEDGL